MVAMLGFEGGFNFLSLIQVRKFSEMIERLGELSLIEFGG